jgi:hypothetical protein
MVRCHASLRATSATICSSAVTASVHDGALESAASNSWRRPASRNTRTAAVASEPKTVIGARWRRPKPRRPAINSAGRLRPPARGDGTTGSLPEDGTAGSDRRITAQQGGGRRSCFGVRARAQRGGCRRSSCWYPASRRSRRVAVRRGWTGGRRSSARARAGQGGADGTGSCSGCGGRGARARCTRLRRAR